MEIAEKNNTSIDREREKGWKKKKWKIKTKLYLKYWNGKVNEDDDDGGIRLLNSQNKKIIDLLFRFPCLFH